MLKRILAVLMGLMLFTSAAFAAEPRDSNYFQSYGATLSKLGSGKVGISMSCRSVDTASQLGVSSYTVYRWDGSYWELIAGPYSGSYKYNASSYGINRTFQGVAGEKYRVSVTFTCVIDGTSETKIYTSGSIVAN